MTALPPVVVAGLVKLVQVLVGVVHGKALFSVAVLRMTSLPLVAGPLVLDGVRARLGGTLPVAEEALVVGSAATVEPASTLKISPVMHLAAQEVCVTFKKSVERTPAGRMPHHI